MSKLPDYPVPALEKGLDILEALAAATVPQSLAELGVRLNRSSSELFRMLNCLDRRGYLTRDVASGKFGLSLKLFALAHGHSTTEKFLLAARGPMRALTEKFRESCHFSVLHRGRLLVVAQQESPDPVRLSVEVGGVFNPAVTASGRLLLAYLNEPDRAAALAELVASGDVASEARSRLKRALAAVRRKAISRADNETIEGVHDLAVLVGNPVTGAIGALAVTCLGHRGQRRKDDARLIGGLCAAAREITRSVGLAPRNP
jgi:DNA-binding IclR family transcriptional regulator